VIVTANATTPYAKPDNRGEHCGVEQLCADAPAATSQIVESAADQSWTDFCKSLKQPAFLLADSNFAD
jgi:hypothetical protein